MPYNDAHGWGWGYYWWMTFWNSEKLSNLKIHFFFFFSFLRKALFSTWKKVQIIVFNKKNVTTSKISISKSPPWNLVKFRSEFFSLNVSRIVCWFFLNFECELMVNYKKSWFLRQRRFAHLLDLFKTGCVFINKNSVFELYEKMKVWWKYDG